MRGFENAEPMAQQEPEPSEGSTSVSIPESVSNSPTPAPVGILLSWADLESTISRYKIM